MLGGGQQASPALLRWSGRHPALQQLQLVLAGEVPAVLLGALLDLKEQRPQLDLCSRWPYAVQSEFVNSFETSIPYE